MDICLKQLSGGLKATIAFDQLSPFLSHFTIPSPGFTVIKYALVISAGHPPVKVAVVESNEGSLPE